jgi:hypothetical protein
MKGITEITVVDYENNEIMVNVDLEKKKVIRVYCYSDSIPQLESGRYLKNSPTKNSLFSNLNLSDFKKYVKESLKNSYGIIAVLNSPEEEGYSELENSIVIESLQNFGFDTEYQIG